MASGSVRLTPNGTGLTITQSSPTAVVNYDTFSIGAGHSVAIDQPSSSAAILNRVTGTAPSTLAGALSANGQVLLVNPNGIAITKTGTVDVGGGFVGSTLDISDDDIKAGRHRFAGKGASASVSNRGTIRVGRGGYAALLGGHVDNQGLISVPMGKVGLGSGETATLDVSGDGFLQVAVPTRAGGAGALVEQGGRIEAPGGTVAISAATARAAARNAVNITGSVDAHSIAARSGSIIIGGGEGGSVTVSGTLDAAAPALSGASRPARPAAGGRRSVGARQASGRLVAPLRAAAAAKAADPASPAVQGGTVSLDGAAVQTSGRIDVSGASGGHVGVTGGTFVNQGTVDLHGASGVGGSFEATLTQSYAGSAGAGIVASGLLTGGRIAIAAPTLTESGRLDATASGGTAGSIQLLGTTIALQGAALDASGSLGGGTVLIGGGARGLGVLPHAEVVTADAATTIAADATARGKGGHVVLWSDERTETDGLITARGGLAGGDGGLVETSSRLALAVPGPVSASARSATGQAGEWLLDPADITIGATDSNMTEPAGSAWTPTAGSANVSVTNIQTALNGGTSVTIQTSGATGGSGNIAVASSIGKSLGGTATLTLTADGNITVNSGSNITSTVGALNTVLTAAGAITVNGNISTNGGTLSVTNGAASSISGVISGTGGLTKAGTGTLTLSGANNFSGVTTITAGTLTLAPATTATMGAINVDGGAAGATLVVSSGTTSLGGNNLIVAAAGADTNASAQIGANLTANGIYVGNANGAVGTVTQTAGTVTATGSGDPNFGIGMVAGSTGTWNISGGSIADTGFTFNVGAYGTGTLNQTGGTVTSSSWIVTGRQVGGIGTYNLSGGSLTETGASAKIYVGEQGTGTLNVSGTGVVNAANFLGISGGAGPQGVGTVNLNGGTILTPYVTKNNGSSATFNFNGGTLKATAASASFLTGLTNVTIATGGALIDDGGFAITIGQALPGVGGLTKAGAGTLTLTGANTYTGATTLSAGTLKAGSTAAFGSNSATTLSSGTLDLAGFNIGLGSLAGTAGTVTDSSATAVTLTVGGANTTTSFGGVLQNGTGGLSLTKTGTGTQTLTGAETYSGATTISAGTLQIGGAGSLGSGATYAGTITDNGTFQDSSSTTFRLNGTISGSGALIKDTSATSTLNLAVTNTFTGGATLTAGTIGTFGTNNLGAGLVTFNGGTLTSNATSTLSNNVVINSVTGNTINPTSGNNITLNGSLTGAGMITKTGAFSVFMSGDNSSFTGTYNNSFSNTFFQSNASGSAAANWVNNGNDLGSQGAGVTAISLGSLSGTGLLQNQGSSALTFTIGALNTNTTFSGSIQPSSAAVSLVKVGTGTLTLTGANTYTGTTTISGGTLQIGNGGATGSIASTAITDNATLVYNLSGTTTLATPTSGSGTMTATIGSALTMNAAVNLTGAGGVALTATSIALNAAVSTPTLNLTATGGGISQTSSGILTATTASAQATGSIALGTPVNAINAIGTFAAKSTGGNVVLNDTGGLTIGTVGGLTGISAVTSGSQIITTGALQIQQPVTTSDTSSTAFVLAAGDGTSAGTSSGGDISLSGAGTVSTGSGGRATLYTGSVSGSTGVGGLGTSGGFRYDSSRSSTGYVRALAAGIDVIYREQPTLSWLLNGGVTSRMYDGTSTALSATITGLKNGDAPVLTGGATSGGPATNVGSYTFAAASATTDLGYASIPAASVTYTITPAPLTVTANAATKTYGQTLSLGSTAFTTSGTLYGSDTVTGVTLTSPGAAASAGVGSYAITPSAATGSGVSNYTLTYATGQLGVTAAPLTVTANAASKTYGQTLSLGSTAFTTSTLYNGDTVTGVTLTSLGTAASAGVGLYAITPSAAFGSGLSNYTLTYATTGQLGVTPAPLTVTANAASKTYGQTLSLGSTAFTTSTLYNGDSVTGVTLTSLGTAASAGVGLYAITPSAAFGSGLSNYTLTYATTGQLGVTPAPLTVTANAASKTYGQTLSLGSTAFTTSGTLYNGDSVTGVTLTSLGTAASAGVGSYAVTPSAATGTGLSNYTLTYATGQLGVTAAPLTVTANAASKTYGQTLSLGSTAFTTSTLYNGDTVTGVTLTSLGTAASAGVGSYAITPSAATGSGLSNYTLTYATTGQLGVTPAPLTITANAASKTYGQTLSLGSTAFATSGTLYGSDTVTGVTLTSLGMAAPAGVGSYAITPSAAVGSGLANYALTFVGGTLTVGQAPLTVTASSASKTYDGLAYGGGAGVTYAGFVNGEGASVLGGTLSYGGTAQGAVNVGSYTITAGGYSSSNYALTYAAGTLTVGQAPLTVTASNAGKTYDGTAFSGGAGVTYAGFVNGETASVLGGGLSYGGTAQGAVNAGSYTIVPGGYSASNYALSYAAGTLTVGQAPLTVTANSAGKTYDGLAYGGGNGVSYSGFVHSETSAVLGGSLSYGGTAQGAVNVGSYTIVPGGYSASNYALAYVGGTLTVGQAPLTVTASPASKTYDGLAYGGGNGVSYAGFVNGETAAVLGGSLSYGGSAQGAVNAGSYGITPGGLTSTNYALTYVGGTLTVGQAPLTVTASSASKTYDGLAYGGGAGVTYAGFVNGEGASVLGGTLSYGGTAQGAVNVGSYTITAGGYSSSNYALTYVGGTLTVGQAPLTVTASNAGKTYDGTAFTGGAGVTYAGFVNGETASVLGGGLSYGGTAQGAVNAGSYTIVPGGYSASNYALAYVGGTLTVGQAPLTVTANSAGKTYGQTLSLSSGAFTTGTLYGLDSVTAVTLTSLGTPSAAGAGSYAITPSAAAGSGLANYALTYAPGTLTVGQAPLTVTANSVSKFYNGQAFVGGNGVTYAGFVNGEGASVLGGSVSYGGSAQGAVAAGSYALTASGLTSANYALTYGAGTLTVMQALLTVKANNAGKTYDGLSYGGGNGYAVTGFVPGDTAAVLTGTVSYGGTAQGVVNAGTYTLTATGLTASNYAVSYVSGSLTVAPAPLTVTANNAGKTYDGHPYGGGNGVIYSGFVNGESAAVLGGSLTYGGTAQGAVNAGSYSLSASGLTSSNYALTSVPGTLTVAPAPLTVTAGNVGKTYDGLAYGGGGGVSYSGFVNGEGAAVLGGSLTYGGTAQGAVAAGSYTLTAGGLTSSNYALSYGAGSLTIAPAPLTVTVNNVGRSYDGTAYSGGGGVTLTGLVNGEGSSVLGGSLSYAGAAQGAVNAGTYALTASGLTSSNYALSYVPGSLTIAHAQVIITANSAGKTYDGTAYGGGNGVLLSGLVNGQDPSVLSGTLTYGGTAQGAVNAGSYTIMPGGLTSNNYTLSYVPGSLTVQPVALTVTANSAGKTYDGLAYTGGHGVTYAGFVNGEGAAVLGGSVSYGGTAQGAVNVGSYVLTAGGLSSPNYTFNYVPGSLTVTRAPLTVTANGAGKIYDGLPYSGGGGVTYAGLVNGETATVLGGSLSYGGTAQGAVNTGSYSLTAGGLTASNYALSYVAGSLTVAPAPLTAFVNPASKTYDGLAYSGGNGVTLSGLVHGETASVVSGSLSYGGAAQGAVGAGSYALTASGLTASNYALSYVPGTLTVTPAPLTVTANPASKTYDGLAYGGGNGVTYAGFVNGETASVLGGSLTYAGTAQGAVNAGSYSITAAGYTAANYALSYTPGPLTVAPAPLTVTANPASKTYDGLAYGGGNGVTYAGFVNGETASVLGGSLIYGGPAQGAVNAGRYAITATGLTSSNYALSYGPGTLTVGQAPLTVTASDATKTYDGLAYGGGHGVTYAGFVNGETASVLGGSLIYGGSAQGAVDAGHYALLPGRLTGSNYALSFVGGTLTVAPAPLTVTATDIGKTYGQTPSLGAFTTGLLYGSDSVTGVTLTSLGAPSSAGVGSYALTPSAAVGHGLANYALTYAAGTLTVAPAPLTVTASDAGKTYDGLAYAGGNGVTYAGFVNGETASVLGGSLSYGGPAQGAVNAGHYGLTVGGLSSPNYALSYVGGTLTVAPAPLTLTASDAGKTYDGLAYGGGAGVTFAGFVNGETASVLGGSLSYGGSAQGAVNAGRYAIVPGGYTASNYVLTAVAGTLTVAPAPLTLTASDAAKTYDGTAYGGGSGVTFAGFVNGETAAVLGGSLAYGGPAQGAVNVGRYAIVPGGYSSSNYVLTAVAGTLTVAPAPLTVTASNAGKTYGQALGLSSEAFTTGTLYGLDSVTGVTLSSLGAPSAAGAGSYAITPSAAVGRGLANYALTYAPGTLTVAPAPLTVTASDAGKTYDGLAYGGGNGVTYAGFVNGETASVLGGSLSYGGPAQGAVEAGRYAITAGGYSASNYALRYVDGTLTVGQAPLTVTASDASKTYDGLAYGGGNGVTYAGFVNGETASVLGGRLDYDGTAQGAVEAGRYTIGVDGLTAANYALTYAAGTLTVAPAPLTVTATDASKTFGQLLSLGAGGFTTGPLFGHDSVTGMTLTSLGTPSSAGAGSYAITPSAAVGSGLSNYAIRYVDGTLTVTPQPLVALPSYASFGLEISNTTEPNRSLTAKQGCATDTATPPAGCAVQ